MKLTTGQAAAAGLVAGVVLWWAWRAAAPKSSSDTGAPDDGAAWDAGSVQPDDSAGWAAPSTRDDSAGVASTVVQFVTSPVRGIRNNNPGNIRKGSSAWRGLSATQSDSAFLQFESMAYGIRALVVTLRTYATKHGLRTVRGIINRWAPPNENDTGAYVRQVATALGVDADQAVDPYDPDTAFRLVRAIIKHENGAAAALLVTDSTVREGIALAG